MNIFKRFRKDNHSAVVRKSIICTIVVASLFFIFLCSPVDILSGAMEPILLEGDHILISKFSYGYGNHFGSIQLPFEGRIFGKSPKRGDIIAFKTPNNIFGIQRVVGLPGDTIQMKRSLLHINGEAVSMELMGDHTHFCEFHNIMESDKVYLEVLPEGKAYEILDVLQDGVADNTGVYLVPKGYYFVMGDNRHEALDSRFKDVGFISFEHIIGKPMFIFFSTDEHTFKFWKWPFVIRWERMLKIIK